jgi:hypothetical protein
MTGASGPKVTTIVFTEVAFRLSGRADDTRAVAPSAAT